MLLLDAELGLPLAPPPAPHAALSSSSPLPSSSTSTSSLPEPRSPCSLLSCASPSPLPAMPLLPEPPAPDSRALAALACAPPACTLAPNRPRGRTASSSPDRNVASGTSSTCGSGALTASPDSAASTSARALSSSTRCSLSTGMPRDAAATALLISWLCACSARDALSCARRCVKGHNQSKQQAYLCGDTRLLTGRAHCGAGRA
eukprot:358826-Chlamydomonas_euryale.AAC.6